MNKSILTREGRLARAIVDFCVCAQAEGDGVVLRDIGIDYGLLQTILASSASHPSLLFESWFPLEALNLSVLDRQLAFLQQRVVEDKLLRAGAPKVLFKSWFAWSERMFTRRTRMLGLPVPVGRSTVPDAALQKRAEQAWRGVDADFSGAAVHTDWLIRAQAWLTVAHAVQLPIRCLMLLPMVGVPPAHLQQSSPVRPVLSARQQQSICGDTLTKEGVLTQAIVEFCLYAHEQGDVEILQSMGVSKQRIQILYESAVYHSLILQFSWCPVERVSRPVMYQVLASAQSRRVESDLESRLLMAQAPMAMLLQWFGWNDAFYVERCKHLGVNIPMGRPEKPDSAEQADIEDAWYGMSSRGEIDPSNSDVLVRARAWLAVSQRLGLSIRVLAQADPVDLPHECTMAQFV